MSTNKNIEDKLEKLGQSISSDEMLLKKVMSQIEGKVLGESLKVKNKLIMRRLIMNRFTKFAAAATIILIALVSTMFLNKSSTPAYGMTDALELLRQAKTLHIRGWYVDRYESPPKEIKLPFEYWYDLENRCYRIEQASYLHDNGEGEIYYTTTVCDGEYIMDEGWYQPVGDQRHKTINFEKIDTTKKINVEWLEWYSKLPQIEGFYRLGQDIIDGERFDIWEGEFLRGVGDHISRVKLQTWLSPATAEVGRSKTWQKQDNEQWLQTREYTSFERNITLPEGIFDTEPPDGYEIQTTKEEATIPVRRKGDIYEETQFGYAPLNYWVAPVFLLNDATLLACWQSVDAKESHDQSRYFKDLQVGGDLPKLPVEVFAFSPEPNVRDMQFIGYHLAFTQKETEKGKRWYEWSLYVPNKEPPEPNVILNYRIQYNLNVDRINNIGVSVRQISFCDPQEIETEDDFNTFVLGAMAELSDDGKAPEGVTYESVLQLAKQIRQSLNH